MSFPGRVDEGRVQQHPKGHQLPCPHLNEHGRIPAGGPSPMGSLLGSGTYIGGAELEFTTAGSLLRVVKTMMGLFCQRSHLIFVQERVKLQLCGAWDSQCGHTPGLPRIPWDSTGGVA